MSTETMCANPCDTCEKKGLPLLLTRYAILPREAGAPALSGNLNDKTLASIPLGGNAAYGLRLLRSGYVYVYDERGYWDEYFVTVDGFLSKLPQRPKAVKTRPAPRTEFACARSGAAPLAGVITIRNAKHAKTVWIGFSDVEWTDATLAKHNDAGYRAKHMTKITVSGGKVSPQPHTAPMAQVDHVLPEFMLDPYKAKKTISNWAPFQFNSRLAQKDDFKAAIKKADPGSEAAIVALMDPSGVTIELASLIHERMRAFLENAPADPQRVRKYAVSTTITQLAGAIRNQAELDAIDASETLARMAEEGPSAYNPNPALWGMPGDLEQADRWRAMGRDPKELDKAADQAWSPYLTKYNEAQRSQWQANFDKALDTYTHDTLNPMATAHTQWMDNQVFQNMGLNFDRADPHSGAAYTALIHDCVRGTAGLKPCFDYYCAQLDVDIDDSFDPKKTLLRALIFNQENLEEAARNASHVDKRVLPWDNIYGPYKVVVEKMGKGEADAAAHLMYELAGPIAKVSSKVLDGPARVILGIMSLHAGKPWAKVALHGSRKAFRKLLVRRVLEIGGTGLSEREIKIAVDKEIKRLEIRGDKLEGQRGAKWIALLDEQQIRGLPKSTVNQADWLQGKLTSPEALQELGLTRWKNIVNSEARMGMVSGILQIVCFTKLLEDEQNAMAADKTEAKWRLAAGGMAIAASVCEVSGAMLEKMPITSGRVAMGLRTVIKPRYLLSFARWLGAAAGVIMAGWDAYKAWDETFNKGNITVGAMYGASSILGLVLTWGFLASWNPLILIILVAGFVLVAWLLEKYKENKLQSWLEQSIFGKGEHYPNAQLEQQEFAQAIK
jgi:hypothetical protein